MTSQARSQKELGLLPGSRSPNAFLGTQSLPTGCVTDRALRQLSPQQTAGADKQAHGKGSEPHPSCRFGSSINIITQATRYSGNWLHGHGDWNTHVVSDRARTQDPELKRTQHPHFSANDTHICTCAPGRAQPVLRECPTVTSQSVSRALRTTLIFCCSKPPGIVVSLG